MKLFAILNIALLIFISFERSVHNIENHIGDEAHSEQHCTFCLHAQGIFYESSSGAQSVDIQYIQVSLHDYYRFSKPRNSFSCINYGRAPPLFV